MSAVLTAVFKNHAVGEKIRTALVTDGFPTDRVELTAREELGQAKLVPREGTSEKLAEYFRKVFQSDTYTSGERWVALFQHAVLDGKAVLAVHPRGDVEIERALEILNRGDPVELRAVDLENQTLEHAAAATDTPVFTWMGKVLAAPGAPDTTGLAKLP